MSLSNPNEQLQNVASKFYKWSGDSGCFTYYDKDNKTNVSVPISSKAPFTFIILDTLSTIKGYSDSESCGFWSNEVKNTKTEQLVVRTKSGVQAIGLYADIKDTIKAKGAKYCQSTYVAVKDNGVLEIANIQLQGVALKAMGDFAKENKVMGVAVQVKSFTEGKKGKTTFKVPVFNLVKISEKTLAEATELDVKLQEYLKAYFAKNKEAAPETVKEAPKAAAPTANPAFNNSKPKEAQHSELMEEESDIVTNMDMPDEF